MTENIPPPNLPERLLTVADVAELVQSTTWFVRAEVRRGHLRALHVGRMVRFAPADVRAWLAGEEAS